MALFSAGIHLCDLHLLSFQTLQGLTAAQVSFGVGILRGDLTISRHKRERVPTFPLERFGTRSERKWNALGAVL